MNTLSQIFDWLLIASFRASVLTLGVLLVQWVLQQHLSPRWCYALWLPVLIVVAAPVLPESQWSIESVFDVKPVLVEMQRLPAATGSMPASGSSGIIPFVSPAAPVGWCQIGFMTWALGAFVLLLGGGFSFVWTLLRFQRSSQTISAALHFQVDAISRDVGLRRTPRVLVAPDIRSPAVTGFLRPTLLLPVGFERDFTANEARLILEHELTHLKRYDLPLNTLLCVLMGLHWFNPLLWLAFCKARADREAACDAQVLANATPQLRSAYGHALLRVEAACSPIRLSIGFIGMIQRGATLRARIRSIALPSPTHPLAGMLAVLCITSMTFLGITRAEKSGDANDDAVLIAIHIKSLKFQQDTTWDFGGRLKQLDPTNDRQAKGQIEVLSEQDFQLLQEQLSKRADADITSWPRMVTKDGKEATIRSVVNHPVLSKDGNDNDMIEWLHIGFVGKFTPKAMQGGKVALDIDITDSHQVATETLNGNEYPVVASSSYSGPLELDSGYTVAQCAWKGYGWKDGKPESYRPTITFITTQVIDPGAQPPINPIEAKLKTIVLPSVIFSKATVEEAVDFLRIKGRALDISSTEPKGVNILLQSRDMASASITLDLRDVTLGEALRYVANLAGLEMRVNSSAVLLAPKGSPAQPSPEAEAASPIILPQVEFREATLDEAITFIRIKSRDIDPAKKGVNILLKPGGAGAKITLSLQKVPVNEALRYIAELAGHTLSVDGTTYILDPMK